MIFLLAVYLFFQLCSHWGYLYFGSDMHYRFLYPLLCITESIMQILVHSYRMFNLVTNFRTKNNLFTFQVGFSHSRILRTVIQHACSRFPSLVPCNNAWTALSRKLQSSKQAEAIHKGTSKQKVFVIFGGDTSERQVSLMSGTNV